MARFASPAYTRSAMETPLVGSLVVPAPRYRDSMKTGDAAAVLLATRRGSGFLYYPSTDRGYWVPTRQIAAIPSDVLPDDSRERVLSDLLLYLCADECELHEVRDRDMTVSIRIPRLTRTQHVVLLGTMGEMIGDLAFEPGSMSSVMLRLELVSLPDPAGAGR